VDPLAHTLFGATLAESGLRRRSRYATATLLIGANLPDIDAVANLWGGDFALHSRRGITHGVLAMVVLPLLLATAVWLWHRWRSHAAETGEAAPFRPRAILGLSFLAVLSHPALDWLNTYGVRLLMPFDGRWFYGDTLFIIDPWFWLLAAAGVVLARSGGARSVAGWIVLAALATWLVLTTELIGAGVKAGWVAGVLLVAAMAWRRPAWAAEGGLARAGLACLALYIAAAFALARMAERALGERFPAARDVQANPAPARPASHRVVVVEDDLYRIVTAEGVVHEVPRRRPDAVVEAALASESVRGFAGWMRYADWTVEEAPGHWIVTFRDLRYQGPDIPDARGIGRARVEVPKSSLPRAASETSAPAR
jgi:inner membrane protein